MSLISMVVSLGLEIFLGLPVYFYIADSEMPGRKTLECLDLISIERDWVWDGMINPTREKILESAQFSHDLMLYNRVYNQRAADYSNEATHDWFVNHDYVLENRDGDAFLYRKKRSHDEDRGSDVVWFACGNACCLVICNFEESDFGMQSNRISTADASISGYTNTL